MYGNYSYPINGNVQQNLAQQRMNNLQNQYNQMFSQQEMMQQQVPQQMQMIKGRPVSSLEETMTVCLEMVTAVGFSSFSFSLHGVETLGTGEVMA